MILSPLLAAVLLSPANDPPGDDRLPYVSVDRLAAAVGLPPLRVGVLPARDLELRVWSGFAWGLEGRRLLRRGGTWSAASITYAPAPKGSGSKALVPTMRPVAAPTEGWNDVWYRLETLDLWTLPNEADLPDDGVRIYDGRSHLFEIRSGARYHAYFYNNPEHRPKSQSVRVAGMVRLLDRSIPRK